jgi:TRAP-type uncharacterized transport system substrate-binding protein
MLEVASELVAYPLAEQPYLQAKITLREQGAPDWPVTLFATSTAEGVDAVVSGEATMAIVNPAATASLAYRGTGPFREPQPIRAVTVIPSLDVFVFAVRPEFGLRTVEDIAVRKPALRVRMRGQADHPVHTFIGDMLGAAGFSVAEITAWGGDLRREGPLPRPTTETFKQLIGGKIDAIFDEAIKSWAGAALAQGMTLLTLTEPSVQKLEAIGYRRAVVPQEAFPELESELLTLDFSGWPVIVRADAPDELVTQICAALVARKHLIPWQGDGPLPIERMCREAPDTPQMLPYHPAAERYWRAQGYLE